MSPKLGRRTNHLMGSSSNVSRAGVTKANYIIARIWHGINHGKVEQRICTFGHLVASNICRIRVTLPPPKRAKLHRPSRTYPLTFSQLFGKIRRVMVSLNPTYFHVYLPRINNSCFELKCLPRALALEAEVLKFPEEEKLISFVKMVPRLLNI